MLLTRRSPLLAAMSLVVLAAPVWARPADAEPEAASAADPTPSDGPSRRELAGHVFMPVLGMVTPFATTSFGTYLTLGSGSTTGSVELLLPGNPTPQTFTGTVSYAAVGGVLGYEYAFLPGFSARFILSETLYSGTTGAAAAVIGTNARIGLDLGLTAGMQVGESVRVAAVLDANYAPQIGLLLGPAIKSAYDSCSTGPANCKFDFGQLFQQENVFQIQPGVAASWAPLKSLGLTGNVTYNYASLDTSSGGTATQTGVTAGAAVDFDFKAVSSVPLGLQVSINGLFPISGSTADRYADLGFGLFYTGRKDVSVGLQVIDRRFKVEPEVDVSWKTYLALLGLRYYW